MALASPAVPARPSRRSRAHYAPRWPWLVPIGVFFAVGMSPMIGLPLMFVAVMALAAVVVLSRHPGPTLVGLVVFLPLQLPLSCLLHTPGLPGAVLSPPGSIKQAHALAISLAAGFDVTPDQTQRHRYTTYRPGNVLVVL